MISALDAVAGLAIAVVGAVAWRHARTTATLAVAAATVWFVTPAAPALVLVHRPLLLHAILALPRNGVTGLLPRLLIVAGWSSVLVPPSAQGAGSTALAVLCVVQAVRASRSGTRSRPGRAASARALLVFAGGLAVPVLEREAWPVYAESDLPLATYLAGVSLCAMVMLQGVVALPRAEDEVIELHGRTPTEALAELRRLVQVEHHPTRARALQSVIDLFEENARLQRDLVDRIEDVRASRARLVQAAVDERQRLERVLAEGAVRYLDELDDCLRTTDAHARGTPEIATCLAEIAHTKDDLGHLARGLHPRALAELGLAGALEELGRRSPVPVEVHAPVGRFGEATETTIWYACAEALANIAKHARASRAVVRVTASTDRLLASIRDDGVGGAGFSSGGGLAGLADRLSVVDGRLTVATSDAGTEVTVEVPLR